MATNTQLPCIRDPTRHHGLDALAPDSRSNACPSYHPDPPSAKEQISEKPGQLPQRSNTLKRKAGSPNLNAEQFSGPFPVGDSVDAPVLHRNTHDGIEPSSYLSSSTAKNIHSIASDLEGYLIRSQTTSSQRGILKDMSDAGSNALKRDILPTPMTARHFQSSSQDSIDCESISSRRDLHASQREHPQRYPTTNLPSDASIPSISGFPLPPHASKQAQPHGHEVENEPNSPTVYHFRGASFEFVNARNSLLLQDIETPAELDMDNSGYFLPGFARELSEAIENRPILRSLSNEKALTKPNHRPTPPKSLFDDLPTAYQSITSRNARATLKETSQEQNTPSRAPFSIPIAESTIRTASSDRSPASESQHLTQTLPPVASFRQKFSEVLRDSNEAGRCDPQLFHLHADNNQSDEPNVKTKLSAYHSPQSQGERRLESQRLSAYSTEFEEDDRSTEDLIASYRRGPDSSGSFGGHSNNFRHNSVPTTSAGVSMQTPNKHTDSTIGDILDQYHRQDTTSMIDDHRSGLQLKRTVSLPAPAAVDNAQFEHIVSIHEACPKEDPFLETKPNDPKSNTINQLRAATALALKAPAKTTPCLPLPQTPSTRLLQPSFGFDHKDSSKNSSLPSALSYGDTRNLLLMSRSETSTDIKQTSGSHIQSVENETLHAPNNPGLDSQQDLANTANHVQATTTNTRRASEKSFENVLNRDIKYLRRLSGLSEFQGSIYVVGGSGSSVQGSDKANHKNTTQSTNGAGTRISLKRESKPPVEAAWVPVAAFHQTSVVPGIFRLATGDRNAFTKDDRTTDDQIGSNPQSNIFDDEESDELEDEDAVEWETLPESGATVQSQDFDNSCSEDWSSYCSDGSSKNPHHQISTRTPAAAKGKLSSEKTKSSAAVPKFEFHPGQQMSRDNSPMPTGPSLYNTYKHPVPLSKTIENPFTSSPIQITESASGTTAAFRPKPSAVNKTTTQEDEDLPLLDIRYQFRPVAKDVHGKLYKSNGLRSNPKLLEPDQNLPRTPISQQDSSPWLSTGPGPEISLEAEHGSPSELVKAKLKSRNATLSSGVNANLIRVLRRDDPRMVSSPLSPSNSFNTLSRLGPKANVTGTPNGTGMREVGSSLVGTSPLGLPESSPLDLQHATLSLNRVDPQWIEQVMVPAQQEFQMNIPEEYGAPRFVFGNDDTPAGKQGRGLSFRDAMMTENQTECKAQGTPRIQAASVEMNTMPLKPEEIGNHVGLPMPATYSSLPKLRRRYRSPSSRGSETSARKQRLSWVLFATCSIFPYMLILYGHGVLDIAMMYWTDGEIEHCGRRQKTMAKILGWGSAAATIFVVVILFAVIRTVPNDLPR